MIVDDCAREVACLPQEEMTGDALFVRYVVEELVDSSLARQILLADFNFKPDWIEAPLKCAYLVDVFAGFGERRENRGKEIINTLILTGVPPSNIAIFTKAQAPEIAQEFGPMRGLTMIDMIEKFVQPDGQADKRAMWWAARKRIVSFVSQVESSPYSRAIYQWNAIADALNDWTPMGPGRQLFPREAGRHNASDWIREHARLDPQGSSQRYGNDLLAALVGDEDVATYSREAILTALKAIEWGKLSARFFAEVAGVTPIRCAEFVLERQLVATENPSAGPLALVGLRALVTDAGAERWKFDIESLEEKTLVLEGSFCCRSPESAREAATTLSKSPAERMAERGREGRPGHGVETVAMVRRVAEVAFGADESTLHCRISVPLDGVLP